MVTGKNEPKNLTKDYHANVNVNFLKENVIQMVQSQ